MFMYIHFFVLSFILFFFVVVAVFLFLEEGALPFLYISLL